MIQVDQPDFRTRDPGESFEVALKSGNGKRQVFHIHGPALSDGSRIERKYTLGGRTHDDYLNLFSAFAADFGTRLPRNRAAHRQSTFSGSFERRLTHDI